MRKLIYIFIIVVAMNGCAARITRYGYKLQDIQDIDKTDCQRVVIKNNIYYNGNDAEVLGKVKAGDSGFSVTCDEEYVLGIFCDEACALGADIVNITEEKQPTWVSSCYRAKAEFLRLRDRGEAESLVSDPKYASELVKERSEKSKEMTRMAIEAGITGGTLGGMQASY